MGLAEALRETIGVLSGIVDLFMGTEGLDEAILASSTDGGGLF